MSATLDLDYEYAEKLIDYDPLTGVLKRKTGRNKGKEAGCAFNRYGHRHLRVGAKLYHAHRVAWLLHYGSMPYGIIDHIDGNGSNNAISNLRLATHAQNMHNRKINSNNRSGTKGVCFDPVMNRWVVQIRYNNRTTKRRFLDLEDAVRFAESTRAALHGEYSRSA